MAIHTTDSNYQQQQQQQVKMYTAFEQIIIFSWHFILLQLETLQFFDKMTIDLPWHYQDKSKCPEKYEVNMMEVFEGKY